MMMMMMMILMLMLMKDDLAGHQDTRVDNVLLYPVQPKAGLEVDGKPLVKTAKCLKHCYDPPLQIQMEFFEVICSCFK